MSILSATESISTNTDFPRHFRTDARPQRVVFFLFDSVGVDKWYVDPETYRLKPPSLLITCGFAVAPTFNLLVILCHLKIVIYLFGFFRSLL